MRCRYPLLLSLCWLTVVVGTSAAVARPAAGGRETPAPTLVKGGPPAQATIPPVVLVYDKQGWILNGRRVTDKELADIVRGVFETRREKHLFVSVPSTFSYPRLMEWLAARLGDGAESFSLIPPGGSEADAVRVQLEALPGIEPDVQLAVADVSFARTREGFEPDAVIRLGAQGDPEPLPATILPKAGPDAVVRLRVDATRTLADLWEVLALGRLHRTGTFLLAVERPDGPGAAARQCREGVAEACGQLGMAYVTGSSGLTKDHKAALTVLLAGCKGRDAVSCELLGTIYTADEGIPPNLDESIRFHTESCRLGSDYSCELLRRAGRPLPVKPPPRP